MSRSARRRRPMLFVPVLAAAILGCGRSPAVPGRTYMPDMVEAVPYEAFSPELRRRLGAASPRPVLGTIARGAAPLPFGRSAAEAERAGRELTNPLTAGARELERGRHLYETFCAVCHGDKGLGDGPIVPKFPNPPSYRGARLLQMGDGQIFHTITYGTALMPGYAAQIPREERWALVHFVRSLQRADLSESP